MKFAVDYVETCRSTYIVEADSYEEAEEKLNDMASGYGLPSCDTTEDFEGFEIYPSGIYGTKPIPENEDISMFRVLENA